MSCDHLSRVGAESGRSTLPHAQGIIISIDSVATMTHNRLLCLCFLPLAIGQQADLMFSKALDSQGSVLLRWNFNKTTEEITFELQVKTTGWVGFGLSPSGGMTGADIVIGGVSPSMDLSAYFSDYHGIGEVSPVLDDVQNCKLLSMSENGTHTTMRYSRKFRTCDPFDVDITFSVPSASTTYGCAYLPLPSVFQKHHIYKFDVVVQSGNEDLVHHILLYSFPNSTNTTISPGTCDWDNPDFLHCSQVLAGWAVGGEAFTLPSNAGISLGTAADPVFVRIEIHYNNPKMQAGRMDSSGIRLYYTPVLRQYDVGILMVGAVTLPFVFIPPRADSYKIYTTCITDMFPQMVGQTVPDMQVFANLLHSHLAGRAIRVVQYRNGSQIGFLGQDMSYDFNLQETRYLPSVVPLKVGDRVQVECTYNTADRSTVTFGGLGTMQEMCLSFLYYYPRNNIASCLSSPNPLQVSLSLGLNASSFPDNLNSLSWSPSDIQTAQMVTKEAFQLIYVQTFDESLKSTGGLIKNITDLPIPPCTSSESSSSAPMATSTTSAASTMLTTSTNSKRPTFTFTTGAVTNYLTEHCCTPLFLLSGLSVIFAILDC